MKLTPKDIVQQELLYSIPIYQRLFEWDTENIITLLDDLKRQFVLSDGKEDYYIGMLTSTQDADLVDGQQRFTVMMLMGCVLQEYSDVWKGFLLSNGKPRLRFLSRPLDDAYLQDLITGRAQQLTEKAVNKNMCNAFLEISKYMKELGEDEIHPVSPQEFAEYVYHHLCFFISYLPENYSPRDLNRYFERMNASGKNLEHHEILKVKLLRNLDGNISEYMCLWNKLADVDTLLIRKRNGEGEYDLASRKLLAFQYDISQLMSQGIINGMGQNEEDECKSIAEVEASSEKPKPEYESNRDSRCALSFEYLLLQTLYRFAGSRIEGSIKDFFNPHNLLDIFARYLPYEGGQVDKERIRLFMEQLVRSRLALDICFVRPSEVGYVLDMNLSEDNKDLRQLMMLQSMLYVSSSNFTHYYWFGWLMDAIEQCNGIPDANFFHSYLRQQDNQLHHTLPAYGDLSYGEIRYWFWRLDLYIWQHRADIFKDRPEMLAVAGNYLFKRNRSIEHIAPQHPESDSSMKWDDTEEDKNLRDSFGNLVMISQGLNSTLRNESYEVKTAHVQAYCNGSKAGSIESLKLLVVHKDYTKWDRDAIREHGEQMYKWLEESFKD